MNRIATTLPYTELPVADGNYDTSRKPIDRVIIHTMVGTAKSASSRFNNPTQQVSAHYGVKLDGGLIHWLEETYTAYHAGDYAVNQRSIGIEHEDNGDYNGVRPDTLYASSAKLVRDICQFYNIPIDRQHILKHSEVHPTGCPDALDIDRIVKEAVGEPMATITQKGLDDIIHARDTHYNDLQNANKAIITLNQKIEQLTNTIGEDARNDHDLGLKNLALETKLSDIVKALDLPQDSDEATVLEKISSLQKPHEEVIKELEKNVFPIADAGLKKTRSPQVKSSIQKIKDLLSDFFKNLKVG